MFQSFFFYHFPSFSHSFRLGRQVIVSLLRRIFPLHYWRIFIFTGGRIQDWQFFTFSAWSPLCIFSCLQGFWWEICHSKSFPEGKVSPFSDCSQDFVFSFQKCNYDMSWCRFLWVYPVGVHPASWISHLVFSSIQSEHVDTNLQPVSCSHALHSKSSGPWSLPACVQEQTPYLSLRQLTAQP